MSDDFIHKYTREQALEDGVLIDLTEWARGRGYKIPVAITAAAWVEAIKVPAELNGDGQSERGRAHDVLTMLLYAIKQGGRDKSRLLFHVLVQQQAYPHQPQTLQLKAMVGPGDDAEPVMTILLPHED